MKEQLLEYLKRRSIVEGECWLWTGAKQKAGGGPVMRIMEDGRRKTTNVRPYVYKHVCGKKIRDGNLVVVRTDCDKTCVNPGHMTQITRAQLQKRLSTADYHQSPVFRKKVRDAAQRRSPINQAIADQIRITDGTNESVAKMYGVSKECVRGIKNGRTWVQTNYWNGLMR